VSFREAPNSTGVLYTVRPKQSNKSSQTLWFKVALETYSAPVSDQPAWRRSSPKVAENNRK
jgi:hypothetical protein